MNTLLNEREQCILDRLADVLRAGRFLGLVECLVLEVVSVINGAKPCCFARYTRLLCSTVSRDRSAATASGSATVVIACLVHAAEGRNDTFSRQTSKVHSAEKKSRDRTVSGLKIQSFTVNSPRRGHSLKSHGRDHNSAAIEFANGPAR